MKQEKLDSVDLAFPFVNEALLTRDFQQNRLRVKESLENFATNAVATMDSLTVALNEGRKDDALREADCLRKHACEVHAETLEATIGTLRMAVWNDEATESIQKLFFKTQTAFQGTIALVKNYLAAQT